MVYAYWLGLLMGVALTLAFMAQPSEPSPADARTETCIEQRPYLMSRKFKCTPAEAEALRRQQPNGER